MWLTAQVALKTHLAGRNTTFAAAADHNMVCRIKYKCRSCKHAVILILYSPYSLLSSSIFTPLSCSFICRLAYRAHSLPPLSTPHQNSRHQLPPPAPSMTTTRMAEPMTALDSPFLRHPDPLNYYRFGRRLGVLQFSSFKEMSFVGIGAAARAHGRICA